MEGSMYCKSWLYRKSRLFDLPGKNEWTDVCESSLRTMQRHAVTVMLKLDLL